MSENNPSHGWLQYRFVCGVLMILCALLAAPSAHAQSPLPSGCQELVTNGSFESTEGWLTDVTSWPGVFTADTVHSGQQAMQLGLASQDANVASHSLVQQSITFPADATQITLRTWLLPVSPADDNDRHYLLFQDLQGQVAAMPFYSVVNGAEWQEQVLDISELAGQQLFLQIGVANDGANAKSALLVDDVSIIACSASSSAADTPTVEPTATETPSPTSTSTETATPLPEPSSTFTATLSTLPQPTATATAPPPTPTRRDLATPTPLPSAAPSTATPVPTASPFLAPTDTPTVAPRFDIDPPDRSLLLLDSQGAPVLIGALVSSVVVLAVLALYTRRPDR